MMSCQTWQSQNQSSFEMMKSVDSTAFISFKTDPCGKRGISQQLTDTCSKISENKFTALHSNILGAF